MGKKTNAQVAYEVLTAEGLSAAAATGVVGNLVIESGVSTTAVGDNGTSRGIAQWHNERWTRFVDWARSKHRDAYDLNTQLAYLIRESQSLGVWEQLKQTRTAQDASRIWVKQFERPKDQSEAAVTRRTLAGVKAVEGAETLPPTDIGLVQGSLDEAKRLAGQAGSAVGGSVVGEAFSRAQPLAYKVAFVLLGVGLVGAGLYAGVISKTPIGAALKGGQA